MNNSTTPPADYSPRVKAARSLVAATQSDEDTLWLLLDHPNEERALNRLLVDLEEKEQAA